MKKITAVALGIGIMLSSMALPAFAEPGRANFTVRFPHCAYEDINGHWAMNDIHNAYWRGIVNTYDTLNFYPDEPASMLFILQNAVRVWDIYLGGAGCLPIENGYEMLYETAKNAGLLNGVDGFDNPENLNEREATRLQMAQLYKNTVPVSALPDINNPNYAPSDVTDSAVRKMYSAGILQGSGGMMNEKGIVTRAEAAVAINRIATWQKIWDIPYEFNGCLGSYTTKYNQWQTGRAHNVALAAKAIDGIVIHPGREFSFNGIVGSRNESRGYQNAPVIVEGEYQDGIGGGVCQVSTTVFNAALLANLEITERFAHSKPTGYVPNGMDATVYYGVLDFKFRNNYSSPVEIHASAENGKLDVSIWGRKDDIPYGVSTKVEYDGKYYILKRFSGEACNYTAKSRYEDNKD